MMETALHTRKNAAQFAAGMLAAGFMLGGCASVTVEQTRYQQAEKPDFIQVYNFAVKPDEVLVDQGVGLTVARDAGLMNQTDEEVQLGRIASQTLTTKLVAALRKEGIQAYRKGDNVRPTARTVILTGKFLAVDEGNRTLRTLVGFGLGHTQLRAQVVAYQNHVKIAEAVTTTGSAPRPGVAVSLGTGAIAGSIGTAAISGGATTAAGELFMSTIEADSTHTANELATRIATAYRQRGWLPPQ